MRAGAELSRENVEERTGINEATLYRIETARARPQRRTLVALLDLYDVTDPQRADLLTISRGAEHQGWLQPYHGRRRHPALRALLAPDAPCPVRTLRHQPGRMDAHRRRPAAMRFLQPAAGAVQYVRQEPYCRRPASHGTLVRGEDALSGGQVQEISTGVQGGVARPGRRRGRPLVSEFEDVVGVRGHRG